MNDVKAKLDPEILGEVYKKKLIKIWNLINPKKEFLKIV